MRSCPLPIDWLDLLAGRPSAASHAHLEGCLACRALTERLSVSMDKPHFEAPAAADAQTWSDRTLLETAPPPEHLAVGQIWWTASEFDSEQVKYERLDRLPVLIIVVDGDGHRSWVDVAPLWNDWENATAADLLLSEADNTLGMPWRVLLRHQTAVERKQLEEYAGTLTADGTAALRYAAEGAVDLRRTGPELESPDDPRLLADEWIAQIMTVLGRYHAAIDEGEDQIPVTPQSTPTRLAFHLSRQDKASASSYALAASSRSAPSGGISAALDVPPIHVEGVLSYDLTVDQLALQITTVSGLNVPVTLSAHTLRQPEPARSHPTVLKPGHFVVIASGLGLSPFDVTALDLEVE